MKEKDLVAKIDREEALLEKRDCELKLLDMRNDQGSITVQLRSFQAQVAEK